jgi:hypothetical protein
MERHLSQNLLPHEPLAYEPSLRFPSETPMERVAHLQSFLLHLQIPLIELL